MSETYTSEKIFINENFTEKNLPIGEYIDCEFANCNFAGINLSSFIFSECTFAGCNLSMVELQKASLWSVVFKDCKMPGLHFDTCNAIGLSITFDGCMMHYCSFFNLKIKKTSFTNCQLLQTDFSGCDITEGVFSGSDLSGVVFENTILEKADFSTAVNYSINPELNRIKKAKFSLPYITGLLHHCNIEIVQ